MKYQRFSTKVSIEVLSKGIDYIKVSQSEAQREECGYLSSVGFQIVLKKGMEKRAWD